MKLQILKISQVFTILLRRDENGKLYSIPYHKQFENELAQVSYFTYSKLLNLAEDEGLKTYLKLRAKALLDDNYQPSDLAWMDMKTNTLRHCYWSNRNL